MAVSCSRVRLVSYLGTVAISMYYFSLSRFVLTKLPIPFVLCGFPRPAFRFFFLPFAFRLDSLYLARLLLPFPFLTTELNSIYSRPFKTRGRSTAPWTRESWEWSRISRNPWPLPRSRNSWPLTRIPCAARRPTWPGSCGGSWNGFTGDRRKEGTEDTLGNLLRCSNLVVNTRNWIVCRPFQNKSFN